MWRFAPDVDPTTPEIYTAMSRMLATPWGTYRSSPNFVSYGGGTTALDAGSAVTGSAVLIKTDGSERWYAGHSTAIYESTSSDTVWTDVKSGAYSASATGWQFAQYGNITIATNKTNNVQSVNGAAGTAFADLAGTPPKAAIVCVQSMAVMLLNYNDGTDTPDGWWASNIGDPTVWTPANSNLAANGRLLETPGAIKAAISFGNYILAFKEAGVYRGYFADAATKWRWELIHPTIGVSSINGVATDGKLVFLYGKSGAYLYDGAQFTRIDAGIEKYLRTNVSVTNCDVVWSGLEQVFCMYLNRGASDSFMNYCPATGMWGVGSDLDTASGLVFVSCVKVPASYERRTIRYGAGPLQIGTKVNGTSYATGISSVTTGWIGNDSSMTHVTDVIPLYVPNGDYSYDNGATAGTLIHKTSKTRGGTMTTRNTVNINTTEGRFNVNHSDRWHEFTINSGPSSPNYTGMELAGVSIVARQAGRA